MPANTMNRLNAEYDILEAAIEAVYREAALRLEVVEPEVRTGNKHTDAIIRMPDQGAELVAEVKKWVNQANPGAVINHIRQLAEPGKGLLVADYINPNLGDKFKKAGIQFIDMAGNAYLDQPPVYIYIKGNKPATGGTEKGKTGKAFQPAGMRMIYAFLKNRNLVNAPYREIAEQAQVALGTVGQVINDLVAQGLLVEGVDKNQRRLDDFARLLDKWVEAYPYKIKEKQRIGTFTTDNPDWWKTIKPKALGALWGGEIAATLYTHYLNPREAAVYIKKEDIAPFLKAGRLRKAQPNENPGIVVDLIEPFWKQDAITETENEGLAHPIIVYADLIATGDPRNLETANRLSEKYLR